MEEVFYENFLEDNDENKLYDWVYYHYPQRWTEVDLGKFKNLVKEENWSDYIKYLDDNKSLSDSLNTIPNNMGGIYVFFVQGPTLPFLERHIAYIGRAHKTDYQNLRKRVKNYLNESTNPEGRIKIKRLFKYWKKYLYIRYLACDCEDAIIDKLESDLIYAIIPPFNNKIVNIIEIKEPKKAFDYGSY